MLHPRAVLFLLAALAWRPALSSAGLPQLVEQRLGGSELHREAARSVAAAAITDGYIILSESCCTCVVARLLPATSPSRSPLLPPAPPDRAQPLEPGRRTSSTRGRGRQQ
jgi:hypothetical protein